MSGRTLLTAIGGWLNRVVKHVHFLPEHSQFCQIQIKEWDICRQVEHIWCVGNPGSNWLPLLSLLIDHRDVISTQAVSVGIKRNWITWHPREFHTLNAFQKSIIPAKDQDKKRSEIQVDMSSWIFPLLVSLFVFFVVSVCSFLLLSYARISAKMCFWMEFSRLWTFGRARGLRKVCC